jgi:hypothetical protein
MGERVERSELNVRHTADVRRRLEDSVAGSVPFPAGQRNGAVVPARASARVWW